MSELIAAISHEIMNCLRQSSSINIVGPTDHTAIPTWFDENGMAIEDRFKIRGQTIQITKNQYCMYIMIFPTRIIIEYRDNDTTDNYVHRSFIHDISSPDFSVYPAISCVYGIFPDISPISDTP